MSQSNLCRLCVNLYKESKSLYDENGCDTELYKITYNYFHPKILDMRQYTNFNGLCLKCWRHICDFHSFQASVLVAQLKLINKVNDLAAKSEAIDISEVVDVKKEQNNTALRTGQSADDGDEPSSRCDASVAQNDENVSLNACNENNSDTEEHAKEPGDKSLIVIDDSSDEETSLKEYVVDTDNTSMDTICPGVVNNDSQASSKASRDVAPNVVAASNEEETPMEETDDSLREQIADEVAKHLQDQQDKSFSTKRGPKIPKLHGQHSKRPGEGTARVNVRTIHKCNKCGKCFSWWRSLKKHELALHPISKEQNTSANTVTKRKVFQKIRDNRDLQAVVEPVEKPPNIVELSDGGDNIPPPKNVSGYRRSKNSKDPQEVEEPAEAPHHVVESSDGGDNIPPPKNVSGYRRSKNWLEDLDDLIGKWKPILKCDLCPELRSKFSLLEKHFRQKHAQVKCYISCCNRKYSLRPKIEEHALQHTDPTAFQCDLCGSRFTARATLKRHQVAKHPEDFHRMYKCGNCEKSFLTKPGLEIHFTSIHSKSVGQQSKCPLVEVRPVHKCNKCGKCFSWRHSLKRHELTIHPNSKKENTVAKTRQTRQTKRKLVQEKPVPNFSHSAGNKNPPEVQEPVDVDCVSSADDNKDDLDELIVKRKPTAFKCDLCGGRFAKRVFLNRHRFAKHPEVSHKSTIWV